MPRSSIVGWDYGRPGAIEEMLRAFDLLVAAREGDYAPPQRLAPAIQPLPLSCNLDEVSATEVRARIARGDEWEHLIPRSIHHLAREIYGGAGCQQFTPWP
jgi:nicotinic acid mononucleotide adenylyltransferase